MKLSLLRAYLSTHKFDVICISETYLMFYINTVVPNAPFLYPMKMSENRKVF